MKFTHIILLIVTVATTACGGGGSGGGGNSGSGGGSGSGGAGGGSGGTGGGSGSGSSATWSTGQILSNQSLDSLGRPSVDIAPDGSAIAAWNGGQITGSTAPLMVSRLSPTGTTWSTPRQIDSGVGNVLRLSSADPNPIVAMDADGNAIVVWLQDDGTQISAFAGYYLQASDTWSTPISLEADDVGAAAHISVAVDNAGNAVAVWVQQTPGQVGQLWANTYSATTQSWSNSTVVDASVEAVRPVISTDANGNFRVFYAFHGATDVELQSRAFDMTLQNWQGAEVISSGESQVTTIQVVQDTSNDWVTLWTAMDSASYESLFVSRRDDTLGTWSSAVGLEALPYNVESMTMVAAPNGKLTIAWSQPDRNRIGYYLDLYIRSYIPSSGWSVTARFDDLGGRIPLLISSGDDDARLYWSTLGIIRETIYSPVTGWSAQTRPICVPIDPTYCSNDISMHDAAMNASKRAVYVWTTDVNGKTVVAASVLQ